MNQKWRDVIMRYMESDVLMVNEALRTERERRGWTQAEVAEALRVSTKTVVRWENGYAVPFPYYRQKLSTLFGKTASDVLMVNEALRTERKWRGWTQAEVAEALRVSTKTVVRWENGYAVPFPYYRQKLSTLFGKTAQELGLL